jgi:WD40-like Beta Propeller Repeat
LPLRHCCFFRKDSTGELRPSGSRKLGGRLTRIRHCTGTASTAIGEACLCIQPARVTLLQYEESETRRPYTAHANIVPQQSFSYVNDLKQSRRADIYVATEIGTGPKRKIWNSIPKGRPGSPALLFCPWLEMRAVSQARGALNALSFVKENSQSSIYISPLNEKSTSGNAERATADTWRKSTDGWTPDSRAIYFSMRRNGKVSIYRQDVHQQVPERVISGSEDYSNARLSPDGTILLYTAKQGSSGPTRLMSMPVDGGIPTVLAKGECGYECARAPSTSCVLSEQKDDKLYFYNPRPQTRAGDWALQDDKYR